MKNIIYFLIFEVKLEFFLSKHIMPGYKEWSEIELQNLEFAASKFVTAKGISWRDVEKFVKTRSARQC